MNFNELVEFSEYKFIGRDDSLLFRVNFGVLECSLDESVVGKLYNSTIGGWVESTIPHSEVLKGKFIEVGNCIEREVE